MLQREVRMTIRDIFLNNKTKNVISTKQPKETVKYLRDEIEYQFGQMRMRESTYHKWMDKLDDWSSKDDAHAEKCINRQIKQFKPELSNIEFFSLSAIGKSRYKDDD